MFIDSPWEIPQSLCFFAMTKGEVLVESLARWQVIVVENGAYNVGTLIV